LVSTGQISPEIAQVNADLAGKEPGKRWVFNFSRKRVVERSTTG